MLVSPLALQTQILPWTVWLHWFRVIVMLRFLSRTPVFLAFPPPLLLFSFNLPSWLAAVADALFGMVNSYSLLLLPALIWYMHPAVLCNVLR
jgi:hypothetical protein